MSIIYVILVLFVLMLGLGSSTKISDFAEVVRAPKMLILGLISQVILLPVIAFIICHLFDLPPLFSVGVMLIACSAGGASSNVLSMLFGGNIPLSTSLTVFSSLISIISLPLVMKHSILYFMGNAPQISLSFTKTVLQLSLTIILPMMIGIYLQRFSRLSIVLSQQIKRLAFPLLLSMIALFSYENMQIIGDHFFELFWVLFFLIALSLTAAYCLSAAFSASFSDQRTIMVEVGIQNAAQAITVALSPFLLNSPPMSIPAVVYAVMMNIFFVVAYFLYQNGKLIKERIRPILVDQRGE